MFKIKSGKKLGLKLNNIGTNQTQLKSLNNLFRRLEARANLGCYHRFNSKYILEMINNLEDENITLSFDNESSPLIATESSNPELIYVLMPMRV